MIGTTPQSDGPGVDAYSIRGNPDVDTGRFAKSGQQVDPELLRMLLMADQDPYLKGYVHPEDTSIERRLITDDEGRTVGFFTPREDKRAQRTGAIWVEPGARGKGYAAQAIRDYIGAGPGRAFIEESNAASRRAFTAAGFLQDAEREERWGGGHWFRKGNAPPMDKLSEHPLYIKRADPTKQAQDATLQKLLQAKAYSDARDYPYKTHLLRQLIQQHPTDFYIDSEDKGIVGVTHRPTGFQIHMLKNSYPAAPAVKQAQVLGHIAGASGSGKTTLLGQAALEAKVIAHIAGPSGSGKTTILERIKEKHPKIVTKDLDEIDDVAEAELGITGRKRNWSDEKLVKFYAKKQEVFDRFLAENKGKDIILAGHHIPGGPSGLVDSMTLKIPEVEKFLLNTGARESARRRSQRGSETGTENIPEYRAEAKKTIKDLKSLGYQPRSPEQITQQLAEMLAATKQAQAVNPLGEVELPDHLRRFDDTTKARTLLHENTTKALEQRFPISDGQHRLELHDVGFEGPEDFSWDSQKRALMSNRSVRRPLKGTWRLFDEETNSVLDERRDTVMNVPYYTQRGTFINKGNEYTVINQARLKPGVFVRTKQSGEHEAHFNAKPGTGRGFRLWMEPKTGIFRVNIGQANIPAYPFMKALGVEDQTLADAWGPEIYDVNYNKRDAQAMTKLYKKFAGKKVDPLITSDDQRSAFLREQLAATELDPDVVATTLGLEGATHLTPELVLAATSKLLRVSRGESETDDREAPEFTNVYGVEDLLPERVTKDAGRTAHQLLWKIKRDRTLKRLPTGALNPYIDSLLLGSGLAAPLEETNPFQLLDQHHRVTKLGQGGIPSSESITAEARDVNPGQTGFIDLVAGPESEKIGVDARYAYNTFKGNDGQVYGEFNDRAGKPAYLRPQDLRGKTLAFPDQDMDDEVLALRNGKVETVSAEEVDYRIPSNSHMYGPTANLAPMSTSFMPSRAFYAAKYWSQYLPVKNGEAPLVQTQAPGQEEGMSFNQLYGRKVGTLAAPSAGVVTKITPKGVTIRNDQGEKTFVETPANFPFNRMSAITFAPVVREGDVVAPGQMIAKSNFTDDTGALNMGVNLKTATIPARGDSFEDAYVLSESAAKRLSTERLYGFDKEARHGTEVGRNKYVGLFPKTYSKDQLAKIGDDGVATVGAEVHKGDPIILATSPRALSAEDAKLGRLHKALRSSHKDASVVWPYNHPGVVTDVGRTTTGWKVNVASTTPLAKGDKISNLAASKGVVGKITPDDEMPRDAITGEPYELLLNPMVVQSRVAPNQLLELQLAKVAKATGKPMVIPDSPPPEGWDSWVDAQLAAAGIDANREIYDPVTGENLKSEVGEGYMYFSAFHHLAEKKLSERDTGGYSAEEQPGRGGKHGSKRMSQQDLTALLAHGATEVIKDYLLVRGTKNEDYWTAMKLGRPLPKPKVPFVYDKFMATLKAGGINVDKQGDILSLMPLTNKDVDKISSGAITNSSAVDGKDLSPIAGGLFDPTITGGPGGKKWSHIDLPEPIPNPIMEEPIRRLLGLKVKEFADVVSGADTHNGLSGGESIRTALTNMDVDAEIKKHRLLIDRRKGAARDNSVKALRYLTAAKSQGTHPSEWILDRVPVIPPAFRPVTQIGDVIRAADLNGLYRDVIETSDSIRNLRADLPEEALAAEKLQLYQSVQAAVGLGEPITPDGQARNWKGAIRQVVGTSPKNGLFQKKVISKTVDVVGRGVITPNPDLDMDSIDIPEEMAWTLYKQFVIRRLVRRGMAPVQAAEVVDKRTPEAETELLNEMGKRPVIMDRAPSWHKFSLMGFKPNLVKGDTIGISPLIVSGFNADFDGDATNIHVPATQGAVKEVYDLMMPSKNLFAVNDLKSPQHTPSKEMVLGLYQATREANDVPARRFKTQADVIAALRAGQLDINDPVIIEEDPT